jgi:hypothetical protein
MKKRGALRLPGCFLPELEGVLGPERDGATAGRSEWHIEEVLTPDVPVQIVHAEVSVIKRIEQVHSEFQQMTFPVRHHEALPE